MPSHPEPFRPSRRFNLEDVFDEATIARLSEIAEEQGLTVEEVIWQMVDRAILEAKGMTN
jgi:hypothetical protein